MQIEAISSDQDLKLEGDVVVIDGCYVLPDDLWQIHVDFWDFDNSPHGSDFIVYKVGEHKIISFATAFGDGEYTVMIEGEAWDDISVDSGTLAIIPMALIDELGMREEAERAGVVVKDVRGDFVLEKRGVVQAGPIRIDTEHEDEEEDWDDED